MTKVNAQLVQAFPIQANTYIGTASSVSAIGFKIVHAQADGDITFNFGGGVSKVVAVLNGADLALGNDCVSVTSTASILMS